MRRLEGPRAWWHGGEEAVNGDVDCFFWVGGAKGDFFKMIFRCFFLFANEGLKLEICSWNRCFFVGSLR